MTRHNKNQALILLGLAMLALVLASASFSNLQLQPGQPFSLGGAAPPAILGDNPNISGGETVFLIIRGVFALALILLPLYILINLFSPEGRQRLLADAAALVLLIALAEVFYYFQHGVNPNNAQPAPASGPIIFPTPSGPTTAFTANTPSWLVTLSIILLALLITAAAAGIYWFLGRRKPVQNLPMQRFAQEANSAVEALQSGQTFKDVVIQCYYQMSQILQEMRGIRREQAMTTREFEHVLDEKGFPADAVRRLTQLFEQVRYGSQTVDDLEKRGAIESLNAIVAYCKNENQIWKA